MSVRIREGDSLEACRSAAQSGRVDVAAVNPRQVSLGRDEFTAKGLSEDELRELVCSGRRRCNAPFDGIGELEERLDAANDFSLLKK